ncbi:MAG: endonuclease III [Anaerolineales bacterium]|nr:MAG: endonuclease III [Anaerolineales bacterium]
MTDSHEHLRAKTQAIHHQLIQIYHQPQWRPHLDPISEVVSTILSQNTSDSNRDRAFERLRARFATWEMVRDAPVEAIQAAIRPAGLAQQKAPRIKGALRFITQERGDLDLDFLKELPVSDAKAWLTQMKGIGPKTAAIILLFSLGMPAFPVDTHVHRVTRRLGLIGPRISAEKAHDILERLVHPDLYYPFHLNVIHHGRQVCHARNPKCEICPLQAMCDYYQGAVAQSARHASPGETA